MENNILDEYGRAFHTIRLSLLPQCNFSCIYCKIENVFYKENLIQNPEFFINIIKNLKKFINIRKVHLTGGEPTLYPYLEKIVKDLKDLEIPEISLTTNGTLLLKKIHNLFLAGLDSINLSLDALEDKILQKIGARKQFSFYEKLIYVIQNYNINLKINSTILKGYNESQILPLLEYCGERKIPVRFLEYMKMGVSDELHHKRFFGMKEILELIKTKYEIYELPREIHSTSRYWLANSRYKFGIIANHSDPFCSDCDRLRIDSNGFLYGCITQKKGIQFSEKNLDKILLNALQFKQQYFIGSNHFMYQIGG